MSSYDTATPGRLATSRIIAAGLIAGVTLFALVAWFMVQTAGPMADDPATGAVMLYTWAGLTFGAIAAALVVWRLKVAPLLERPHAPRGSAGASRDLELQTGLVITWALMEGPALFGIIVFLLYGVTLTFAAGLLLVWLGIGLTFPRASWYD